MPEAFLLMISFQLSGFPPKLYYCNIQSSLNLNLTWSWSRIGVGFLKHANSRFEIHIAVVSGCNRPTVMNFFILNNCFSLMMNQEIFEHH